LLTIFSAGISRPLNDPNFLETKNARIAEGKLAYDLETFEGFESIFKLNISATYFVSVAFIDLLVKGAKSGKGEGDETANIINVSSAVTEIRSLLIPNSVSFFFSAT
jgi:NAD(P)-dependent dehydrogenase (short-subunit alcohol dehydrogenase family)